MGGCRTWRNVKPYPAVSLPRAVGVNSSSWMEGTAMYSACTDLCAVGQNPVRSRPFRRPRSGQKNSIKIILKKKCRNWFNSFGWGWRPVNINNIRFEVFTAVTMKNGVFWVVTPCGSCKNRRFGGTWRLLHQVSISSQSTSVASCSLCCS
jgi:hypothetical protein